MRVRAPHADYWLPFLPDAYFELIYPDGDVQACIVEIDMGTLTLRRFVRKVQAFETVLEDEVFRRHIKRDVCEVLVLTQSKRRLEAPRHVAGRVVPADRQGDYYLATFDEALTLSEFASATWRELDGETFAGVLVDA
jgi:hypothetical protein